MLAVLANKCLPDRHSAHVLPVHSVLAAAQLADLALPTPTPQVLNKARQAVPTSAEVWITGGPGAVPFPMEASRAAPPGRCICTRTGCLATLAMPMHFIPYTTHGPSANAPALPWLSSLAASKLEEANGQPAMPDKIVPRGIKSLAANGVVIDREWWLKVGLLAAAGVLVGGYTAGVCKVCRIRTGDATVQCGRGCDNC